VPMRAPVLLLFTLQAVGAFRLPAPASPGRAAFKLGASSIAALGAPLLAHADSIEEIAARANARAEAEAAAKAAAQAAGDPLGGLAAGALNLVLSGGILALLAAVAFFLFQTIKDGQKADASIFTKDPAGNTPDGYKSTFTDKD
jgi:hypothetical protein